MDINVFYSTFTNVFLSRFYVFYSILNDFYIYAFADPIQSGISQLRSDRIQSINIWRVSEYFA